MALRLATYYHAEDIPSLPGSDAFCSVEMFQAFQHAKGFRPLLLVAYEDERAVGKLLCLTRKCFRSQLFFTKTYVYGTGEYFPSSYKKEEIFRELLARFTSIFKERAFLLEFRNLKEPLFGYRYFREYGYFPIRWLRVRNSVHGNCIDKWMSISRKRQISRGLKNGAEMDVARTEQEVKDFFNLLRRYYSSKIYRYLPDIDFFLSLQKQSSERAKIFIIRYKGRIIGGSVCLFSDKDAYLLFSGGLRKSYPLQYPGVLAVWNAMTYAHDHGYDHFEFIEAGLPFKKYGYRDFILRFGGRQMSSRRWFRVGWGWLNRLLIKFYV